MNPLKWVFLAAGVVGLMMIGGLVVIYLANESRHDLPKHSQVSHVHLTESSGREITENDFRDRISIVNFFFTSCKGPCPRMNAKVGELYRRFSGSDRVRFYSVSVDPENDSLSVLREYAKNMGVTDSRWQFLRGPAETVQKLSEKIFFLPGDMPAMHSTKLVLVDPDGWIRGYYSSDDEASLQALVEAVKTLNDRLVAR